MNNLTEVKVSVICNTYNHGKYIRDALEGFVKQKTNFAFEVLVHDDASTDDTADIIREYAKKYPDLIKPIIQTENQYSKGIKITKTYQDPRAQGEFIAFCEGDDYWTDCNKLQRQYEAMIQHPEVDMCAHAAYKILASNNKVLKIIAPSNKETVFATGEVIAGGGGFVATNSLFYRKKILEKQPQFMHVFDIDYALQIYGSLRGGLLYLPEEMSVYRYRVPGSWTVRASSGEYAIKQREKIISMLQVLNGETSGKYNQEVEDAILELEFEILGIKKEFKTLRKDKYYKFYKNQSFNWRIKTYIKEFLVHLNLY